MATTYVLAPEPFWTLINLQGTVAGGGKLITRRSLNIDEDKPVFEDPLGTNALTNPIIFDANGVAHTPFYFQVDSAAPLDTYFLQATDADGAVLWTIRDFAPGAAGGGGGGGVVYQSITNYIANNQFINHIDDTASPINATDLVIAPSNHKGFTPALLNPVVGTYGVVGPDIRFVKNIATATDQITFPLFPLASEPMAPGDVTPVDYINYVSNQVIGETYKCFQFPITQKVKNLSNQVMTFTMWAKATTLVSLTIYTRQYYGSDPTATPESLSTRQNQGTMALTATWTQYSVSITVPDVAGNSIGNINAQTDDDALYIQVEMPLQLACDVSFTKPALYLGDIDPQIDFDNYDQIDSIDQTPRTGDIKTSLSSSAPRGWVPMDDGSIGNVGSGATNRANKDTFQLYKTIWDGVDNAYAPVSGGPARGASAIADFLANRTLTLPRSLGRALAGAGNGASLTPRPLGQYDGFDTHALTIAEMPNHDHPGSTIVAGLGTPMAAGGGAALIGVGSRAVTVAPQGGGTPFTIVQPTTFFNVFIKL